MLFSSNYIVVSLISAAALAVAAVWDVRHRTVPNWITFPLILCGLFYTCLSDPYTIPCKLLFALCLFLFGTTGLIGLGDIKLVIGLGIIWVPELALCSAAAASLFIFLIHFVRRRISLRTCVTAILFPLKQEKTTGNSVPFAPYLLFAYILIQGGMLLWLHGFGA